MKTTGSGGVVAQFEFELDKPHKSFPAGLPGFGEANPNVHHGVIRVTKQAPPMHQVTQEQREAAAVSHVVVAQKRSSNLDCEPQLTRHRWQLLAALHLQHQHPCLPLRHPRLPSDLRQPG